MNNPQSAALDASGVPGNFTVTISAYLDASGEVVTEVAPKILNLTAVGDSVNITFSVVTTGFQFASRENGIVPGPSPTRQPKDNWDHSFTTIEYLDDNTATVGGMNQNGLAYSYTVNVIHVASKALGSVDPIIQNENR